MADHAPRFTPPPAVASARGRYRAAVRHYGPDDPRTVTLRRALDIANLEAEIRRTLAAHHAIITADVDRAPLLSSDTRARLAMLLDDEQAGPDLAATQARRRAVLRNADKPT